MFYLLIVFVWVVTSCKQYLLQLIVDSFGRLELLVVWSYVAVGIVLRLEEVIVV